MAQIVAFVGSRSLTGSSFSLCSSVAGAVTRTGSLVHVGCATGADQAALQGASSVSVGSVSVFSAFGPGGSGSCPVSAVREVRAFARCGGYVSWWAGGGSSVPLRVRLAVRARVVVAGSSSVVAFFENVRSVGTLKACQFAVSQGLPVFAFGSSLPLLGAGSWVDLSLFSGVVPPGLVQFPGCFVWVSGLSQLAFF